LRESAPGVNPVTLLDGLVYSAPAGGAQVNIPISLGANQTFVSANAGATITFGAPIDIPALQTLSLDGRGSVDLEGVVSGTGGLTKYGDGTLILAANNTYQGITNVFQGAVNLRNSNALGSAAAGTVAASGTAIQLQGGITVPENIVIRDTGPGFDLTTLGAIRSLGTATNTLSGVVTMTNHAGFGVDPGGRLVSTGQVLAMPGSSDNGLSLFGGGTLELAGTADNAITGQVTVAQGTLVLNKDRGGAATPMPFFGNLVIGDNRDGVGAAGAARVVLSGRDQLPELNFFRTGVTTITLNANGSLDLAGFNDQVGNLTLTVGRDAASQVSTGAGTLSLLGDVTVNTFQGSSGLSPAARVSGNLNLGAFFSGAGGANTRTFTVNDTALFSLNPDLVVSANVSGVSNVSLTKAGGGTLLLSGNNTYQGATRMTAGFLDLGTDTALGNTSLLAISGGALRAVDPSDNPAARTFAAVPVSLDGTVQVYGPGALTFGGQVTLTGGRTFINYDPAQVTTFTAGITDALFPGSSFTKQGRGELNIAGPAAFTGTLTIGSTGNAQDGGTLRFSGAAGALVRNFNTISVGVNSSLILDNTAANNTDRLPDATAITLAGALRLIGNAGGTAETVGSVNPQGGFTSTIESDTTGAGSARLTLGALNAGGTNAAVHFVGGGTRLTESGQNQIDVLQAPGNMPFANNILTTAVAFNPDGSPDFATLAGGPNGLAVIPLPAEGYVTSFAASNPTSNVKITSGTVTLDRSRTVNAVLIGAGVTLNAADTTATLTLANGPLVFAGSATVNVPYVAYSTTNPTYIE